MGLLYFYLTSNIFKLNCGKQLLYTDVKHHLLKIGFYFFLLTMYIYAQ